MSGVFLSVQVDLTKRRVVDEGEGRLWAESRGFHYFETSAQSGEGINEMFQVNTHTRTHLEVVIYDSDVTRRCACISGVLLVHHRHVRERRQASGGRGQRRLHQGAGRHHPTHPQQQGLMGHAGRQTRRHTVSKGSGAGVLGVKGQSGCHFQLWVVFESLFINGSN